MSDRLRDGAEMPFTEQDIKQAAEKARKELIARVCGHLEQQYGRKFIISRMIVDPGILRVKLIVRTQDEPAICFTAESDESEEIRETYVRSLCLNELKASVEAALPGTAVNAVFLEDYAPETDTGLSLSSYLRKHDVRRILVRMIAEDGLDPEKNEIISVIETMSRKLGADIAVHCFTLSDEGFQQCLQKFQELPSVSETMIRTCSPVSEFSVPVENGAAHTPEVN